MSRPIPMKNAPKIQNAILRRISRRSGSSIDLSIWCPAWSNPILLLPLPWRSSKPRCDSKPSITELVRITTLADQMNVTLLRIRGEGVKVVVKRLEIKIVVSGNVVPLESELLPRIIRVRRDLEQPFDRWLARHSWRNILVGSI